MSTAKVNGKTIYIGANTSAVANALKDVEARAQKSKSELKLLEKALKLDPSNVELLNEKQKTLSDSIKTARERLQQLEQASEKVKAEYEGGEIDKGQYLKFKTAVLESQNELKKLTEQAKKNDDAIENASEAAAEGAENTENLGDESQETAKELEKTADKANKTSKKFDLMGASAKTAKAAVKGVTSVLKASAAVFTTYVAGASAVAVASVNVGKEFEKANSQLAATMGTTTDQITDLTQKAKELGEKTSFSATEAAQGLNILAQAGLNSEEQIASIATVLDLAAAGTLTLEDSASYVTGTVKGFGDEMANAQYYADLMAKGATLANTDVQGLGEALGKASATAHSYGETAESVTLSLLKLANQNVTGETAATMLNRAMADLYTPTDNAKMALDELGIACYDANGETRDFNTVVAELNGKLSTMTDEQANAYKNTIFTVNGLNAFNKMCATSAEQSDEFAKGLSTASDGMGSAAQQAETMLDNLEGQITLMKSAAEGFGITVYEGMQEPLKNLMQEGTGYISQLNEAFKTDGVTGAITELGTILSDITSQIATQLPQFVSTAVSFAQSFTDGILMALPNMIPSVIEAGKTLFYGLIDGSESTLTSLISMLPEYTPDLVFAITNIGTRIFNATAKVVNQFVYKIPEFLPRLLNGFFALVKSIGENIGSIVSALTAVLPDAMSQIFTALQANLPDITQGLLDFILQITTGLLTLLPDLLVGFTDVITSVLLGLSEWLSNSENTTTLVNSFVNAITSVVDALPIIITNICVVLPQIITSIVNTLLGAIPELIHAGVTLLTSVVDNLPKIIDTIVVALPKIVNGIIDALLEHLPAIIDAGVTLFASLIENIPLIISTICQSIPEIVTAVLSAFAKRIPDFANTGLEIFTSLVKKIPEILTKIGAGLSNIWTGIINYTKSWISGFTEIGKNLLEGLWKGLENAKDWLVEKIGNLCGTITDSVKGVFGIHSPSKLFADEVGTNLALGIGEGFGDSMNKVTKDMTKALPNSLDVSPTITGSFSGLKTALSMPDFPSISNNTRGNAVTANNGVVLNLNIENFSNNSGQDIKKLAKMLSDEIEKNQNQTNLEINRRLVMW